MDDCFWNNPKQAQFVLREYNALKKIVNTSNEIDSELKDLLDLSITLKEDYNDELFSLLEESYFTFVNKMESFELNTLLSNEYDQLNCILEIHPGAGGTESCDWANMLYRMYSRYAEKNDFSVKVIDFLPGDITGIKSITLLIEGELAYGKLKGERGVHRLVRISPFDSQGKRHTSFASVDVMPEFNDQLEVEIEEKDLKIETMRASGAGGQHINKTDSAVRITHIPTGISVKCQDGRSQIQNREQAMVLLKSKLYQQKIDEQEKKILTLKGEQQLIEWGSQIRSYIFHPYTLVKDHRSNYETSNGQAVMDGDLDEFIFSYLKSRI